LLARRSGFAWLAACLPGFCLPGWLDCLPFGLPLPFQLVRRSGLSGGLPGLLQQPFGSRIDPAARRAEATQAPLR
jgi:hypothetical protein